MPPSSSDARAANASSPSRSARSIVHARESGACSRHCASTASSLSVRRAQMPTVAPRSAKPIASPAPMPADAPVTSTCLPFRSYVTTREASLGRHAAHARVSAAHGPGRGRHRRRAGDRRGDRGRVRRVRCPRRVVRSRCRRAGAHRRGRRSGREPRAHGHARRARRRHGPRLDRDPRPGRRARQQRGRRLLRRVPRRERQGSGLADP